MGLWPQLTLGLGEVLIKAGEGVGTLLLSQTPISFHHLAYVVRGRGQGRHRGHQPVQLRVTVSNTCLWGTGTFGESESAVGQVCGCWGCVPPGCRGGAWKPHFLSFLDTLSPFNSAVLKPDLWSEERRLGCGGV